eukprot:XP_024454714.1 uncharacterized protein LOC7468368 [Populus trichocarpa]
MESYVPAIVVWLCCWFSLPVFFPGSFALRALSASLCCCFFFGFKTMLPFIGCKLDCCLKLGIKEHGFQSLLGSTSLDFDEETTSSQKQPVDSHETALHKQGGVCYSTMKFHCTAAQHSRTTSQFSSKKQMRRFASSFHESEQLTKKQQTSLSTPAEVYTH